MRAHSVFVFLTIVAAPFLAPAVSWAGIIQTKVEVFGGFDLAGCRTYAWLAGTKAPSPVVERATRDAVDKQLAKKGATAVQGSADCYVRTHLIKDENFPGGELRVEVLAGAEPSVAWRGLADGVVTIKKPAKRGKMVAQIIKKLFKSFPEVE